MQSQWIRLRSYKGLNPYIHTTRPKANESLLDFVQGGTAARQSHKES